MAEFAMAHDGALLGADPAMEDPSKCLSRCEALAECDFHGGEFPPLRLAKLLLYLISLSF